MSNTPPPQRLDALHATLLNRIEARRIALGMTQKEMYSRAGLSRNGLSHLRTQDASPSLRTVAAIAKVLETTVSHLTGDDTSTPRVDRIALESAIRRTDEDLTKAQRATTPEQRAALYALRYDIEQGEAIVNHNPGSG